MWYLLGKILVAPPKAQIGSCNYAFVDRFTIVHFMIGIGYAFLGLSIFYVISLAVIWEIAENPLKFYLKFLFPDASADTLKNIIGDICAVVLGWVIVNFFPTHSF